MTERPHSGDRGFSLVELLIVIVILGILATVAVFAVRGITDRSQESACATDHKVLTTAVEAYLAKERVSSLPATGVGPQAYEQTLVDGGMLNALSVNYDIAADGTLNAQNATCT